jgi:two-component system CheB/CheR fusion protein
MDEETLLPLMLEQARDHALVLLDAHGRVVAWLMGATPIFGHDAVDMLGSTIERLFTPEDRERKVPSNELTVAAQFGTSEDDRWMVRGDGSRFWASGMVRCLRAADGSIAGFSKLLRDRTDVRGQIESLRNRADALIEEDKRKTVVLGTLAHELRNPLGVLANAVQLIDMAYPQDPKLSYAVQLIGRQTRFLSTLIEDLLEVVRARTGKIALQVRTVALKEVLEDALESASAGLRQKGQQVEMLLPQVPIVLDADPTRLKQVFINLLSNAVKFSGQGATIQIGATTEGDEAVVRMEDQGHGIPPELLPHIFELFSQAPGPPQDGADGLGLGLSIVKEYVELHGGTVQVRSAGPGQGSEFIVRLPLKSAPAGPPYSMGG